MDQTLQADPNAYAAALQSSPNFVNPQYATPEQIAYLRAQSAELMKPTTVNNWAQGLAELGNTAAGVLMANKANQGQQAALAHRGQIWSGIGPDAQSGGAQGGILTAPPPTADNGLQQAALPPIQQPQQQQQAQPQQGAAGAPASASAYGPASDAMNFYQSKGLSPVAAAGMAGTFSGESGGRLNPNAVNPHDGKDGSDSIGMGQWNGPRAQALQQFAAANGLNPADRNTQLEFSWQELNGPEKGSLVALQNAKTPQDAAVAAVNYERPAGWTPQNPMGANSFGKRLAATNSLLGQAGTPQQMAQAQPQMQGGAPQQGGQMSPITGMTRQQLGAIMADPWTPEETKRQIISMQSPQMFSDAFGGQHAVAPGQITGQAGTGAQLAPGGFVSSIGAGGASVPTVTTVQNGKPSTALAAPGGAAGLDPNKPLGSTVDNMVHYGQNLGAQQQELGRTVDQLADYRSQGQDANIRLGQIGTLRALGDNIGSGIKPMLQNELSKWGIETTGSGTVSAYNQLARTILPLPGADPHADAFREQIPVLSATPEGRHIIADTLSSMASYNYQRGQIAGDQTKPPQDRMARISQMKAPQFSLPDPQGGQGAAPAPQAAGQAPVQAAPAPGAQGGQQGAQQPPVPGARHAPDGNWYVPDPSRPGKYLQVKP